MQNKRHWTTLEELDDYLAARTAVNQFSGADLPETILRREYSEI